MALGRKTNAVSLNGSDLMVGMEVVDAGLYSGTTFVFPIIQTSDIGEEEATENIPTESGTQIQVAGSKTATFTTTVVQKDFETLNFAKTYKAKTLAFIKPVADVPLDGKYIFTVIPNCTPSQTRNLVGDSATVDINFNVNPVTADTEIDISKFADPSFPVALTGLVTVLKGEFYGLVSVTAP